MSAELELPLLTDLVYRSDHDRGKLDLILPAVDSRSTPVVIVVHGGGWREGSKEAMRLYGDLLASMGLAAVIPNAAVEGPSGVR